MTWVDPDVDGEEDEDDEEPGGLDTCEVTVTPPPNSSERSSVPTVK